MGIRKNVISNVILTSSNVLFPLVTFPYVSHILSNESYGRMSFTDAFTNYFLTFAAIGIPLYGVREIAKVKDQPEKYSKLVAELVGLQFGLSVFFAVVFLILQQLVPSLHGNGSLVKIACITIISSSFSIEWFFQGVENFGYITKRSIFTKALNVGSIFLFVKNPDDFDIYYLISALTIFVNATWNFTYFLRQYYKPFTGSLSIKPHLKPLLVLFSIIVSVSIYTVFDTIILGLFTDPATVSLYTVPLKLVKMFWTVVGSIGVVLIPKMANLFVNNDQPAILELIKKSSNIVFLLTIPFAGFCLLFPGEILLMISGDKYLQAAGVLRVLSLVPLIVGIGSVLGGQYLMPIGHEKQILHATIVGLVVSLTLNFSLISYYKELGASIACIAAELAVGIYIYISAKRRITVVFDRSLLMLILTSLMLTLACGLVLQGRLHPFAFLFVVGSIYCGIFFLLQLFLFKNHFLATLLDFKKLNPLNQTK